MFTENVRSLHYDDGGNLWAGLNLAKIRLDNSITFLDRKYSNINSNIHKLAVFNDKIYIATDRGLLKSRYDEDRARQTFHQIQKEKLTTQIWSVIPSKEYLFLASSEGIVR